MKTIDLTKEKIRSLPHVDIDSLNFSDAQNVLNDAEKAYLKQKKILSMLKKINEISGNEEIGTFEYDFMYDDTFNLLYGDNDIEILFSMESHLMDNVERLQKLIKDLTAHIDWLQGKIAHQETCHTQAAKEEFYATR